MLVSLKEWIRGLSIPGWGPFEILSVMFLSMRVLAGELGPGVCGRAYRVGAGDAKALE